MNDYSSNSLPSHSPKVAIITSGYLPVPNVLGGAVEALDTMLIHENERNPLLDLTVFSSWVDGVDEAIQGIGHTRFSFVKTPILLRVVDYLVYLVAKYVLRKKKLMSYRYIIQRLWYIRRVSKRLSNENFDAVIIENHSTLFMTMKFFDNDKRYAGKLYYHLHNKVIKDFGCGEEIAQVHKVLGVSNYIVDSLDKFLHIHEGSGLKPEQCAVLRNCIDTEAFNPANKNTQLAGGMWRKKLDIREDEIVFLFSGRLTREKGAEELLKAFMSADFDNARLVVAGSVFFDSKISSSFENHLHLIAEGSANRILFTGFVDYTEMPGIYAMSDVCCLPSIWDDPAPLAVIESLASGRPLITTRSGGIPEYADERSAIILDRDDTLSEKLSNAMIMLANNPDVRLKMGQQGAKIGRELNQSAYLNNLSSLIGE